MNDIHNLIFYANNIFNLRIPFKKYFSLISNQLIIKNSTLDFVTQNWLLAEWRVKTVYRW